MPKRRNPNSVRSSLLNTDPLAGFRAEFFILFEQMCSGRELPPLSVGSHGAATSMRQQMNIFRRVLESLPADKVPEILRNRLKLREYQINLRQNHVGTWQIEFEHIVLNIPGMIVKTAMPGEAHQASYIMGQDVKEEDAFEKLVTETYNIRTNEQKKCKHELDPATQTRCIHCGLPSGTFDETK